MRAGELECKLHGDSNPFQKILLFVYRLINGFGLRWIRALVFCLICLVVFSLFYWGSDATWLDYEAGKEPYVIVEQRLDNWLHALRHSVETSIVVLPTKYTLSDELMDLTEGAQRLLSPLLFLAFLQAVRNAARD